MSPKRTSRSAALLTMFSLAFGFSEAAFAGSAGTRITGSKTALSKLTRLEKYSWNLTENLQVPNQVTLVIPQGQSAVVGFNLVATRIGPEVLVSGGSVQGEVCITNTGTTSTQGLRIRDQLEEETSPGVWRVVQRTTIPVRYELRPGSRRCFQYEFEFEINSQARYRNKAIATIDNYSGFEGEPRSIVITAPVEIEFTNSTVDASATLSDPFSCPAGFSCQLSGTIQAINDSTTVPFTVLLTNQSANCGQTLIASDTGTLIPSDTRIPVTADAGVTVYTGSCRPNDRHTLSETRE